jgi:hypothetical protein
MEIQKLNDALARVDSVLPFSVIESFTGAATKREY